MDIGVATMGVMGDMSPTKFGRGKKVTHHFKSWSPTIFLNWSPTDTHQILFFPFAPPLPGSRGPLWQGKRAPQGKNDRSEASKQVLCHPLSPINYTKTLRTTIIGHFGHPPFFGPGDAHGEDKQSSRVPCLLPPHTNTICAPAHTTLCSRKRR